MIKVNDKAYELGEFDIKWGKFWSKTNGVEKTGIAPRVFFYVGEGDDEKEIIIELTFTDKEFKELEIGKEINLKKEITDIIYNDKGGWLSISDSDYTCSLTKLEEDKFHVKFECHASFDEITIEIDEILMTK